MGQSILSQILPRPLGVESGAEGPVLMNALITSMHLDRRRARATGWRGVRPSFSHGPTWSARIAGDDHIHGLVYEGEDWVDGLLSARFAWFVLPAEMGDIARELSAHVNELEDYRAGSIEWIVDQAADGTMLTLETTVEDPLFLRFYAVLAESLRVSIPSDASCEYVIDHEDALTAYSTIFGRFVGQCPGERVQSWSFAYVPSPDVVPEKPVVHVLTGFLGSGKTTFLRGWLEYLNGRERFTGVIQNEFGETDLDSLVLAGTTKVESIDEGCVCCSLADSLRPGLERLMASTPAEQFIIETTGIARASSVMNALWALDDEVTRGLMITVVDAHDLTLHPEKLVFDPSPISEARRDQIVHADVIVISKAEDLQDDEVNSLKDKLEKLNPDAVLIPSVCGRAPFAVLENVFWDAYDRRHGALHSRQVDQFVTHIFKSTLWHTASLPDDTNAYDKSVEFYPDVTPKHLIESKINEMGTKLLRAKGVVDTDEGTRILQHVPGHTVWEMPDEYEGAKLGDKRFVVFILEKDKK